MLSKGFYLKFSRCQLNSTQQHLRKDVLGAKGATEGEHVKPGGSSFDRVTTRVQDVCFTLQQGADLGK